SGSGREAQPALGSRKATGLTKQEMSKRAQGLELIMWRPRRGRAPSGLGDVHLQFPAEVVREHSREREFRRGGVGPEARRGEAEDQDKGFDRGLWYRRRDEYLGGANRCARRRRAVSSCHF